MNPRALWRRFFSEFLLLIFDFYLIYMCICFFSFFIAPMLFNLNVSDWWRITVPQILLCSILLLIYKGIYASSRKTRIGRYIDPSFFGLTTLLAAFAYSLSIRSSFHYLNYPKIWDLFAILLGSIVAWFLRRRLKWRTAAFFFSILLLFNLFFILSAKDYVNESDFLPLDTPGVKIVCAIHDPLRSEEPIRQKPILDAYFGWFLGKFAGLLVANYQYGYIALSAKEDFLYVNDSNLRGLTSNIFKIRLDNFEVVASTQGHCVYRDMLDDETSNSLIVAAFYGKQVCYFSNSTLENKACVDLPFVYVQNIIKYDDGTLIVTSEMGGLAIVSPTGQVVKSLLLRSHTPDAFLDKTHRFLVIGSMEGVIIFDLADMRISRRRYLTLGGMDLALDLENNRIFHTRTFFGDLIVLDYPTLKTISRVRLDPGIRCVYYVAGRNIIVAGNYFNGRLDFIDGNSYRVISTFQAGTRIRDIQYSALHDKLYVSTALRILEIDLGTYLERN